MTEKTDISRSLDELAPGTEVRIELADGSEVAGTYQGNSDDVVQLEDRDDVEIVKIESVLLDVPSLEGPE